MTQTSINGILVSRDETLVKREVFKSVKDRIVELSLRYLKTWNDKGIGEREARKTLGDLRSECYSLMESIGFKCPFICVDVIDSHAISWQTLDKYGIPDTVFVIKES